MTSRKEEIPLKIKVEPAGQLAGLETPKEQFPFAVGQTGTDDSGCIIKIEEIDEQRREVKFTLSPSSGIGGMTKTIFFLNF